MFSLLLSGRCVLPAAAGRAQPCASVSPPHGGPPPAALPVITLQPVAGLCVPLAPPLCAVTSTGLAGWLDSRTALWKSLSYLIFRVACWDDLSS